MVLNALYDPDDLENLTPKQMQVLEATLTKALISNADVQQSLRKSLSNVAQKFNMKQHG